MMMACFRAEEVARIIVDTDQDSDDYSDIEEDPQFPLPRLEDDDDPGPSSPFVSPSPSPPQSPVSGGK